jgi:hypothetical protein
MEGRTGEGGGQRGQRERERKEREEGGEERREREICVKKIEVCNKISKILKLEENNTFKFILNMYSSLFS